MCTARSVSPLSLSASCYCSPSALAPLIRLTAAPRPHPLSPILSSLWPSPIPLHVVHVCLRACLCLYSSSLLLWHIFVVAIHRATAGYFPHISPVMTRNSKALVPHIAIPAHQHKPELLAASVLTCSHVLDLPSYPLPDLAKHQAVPERPPAATRHVACSRQQQPYNTITNRHHSYVRHGCTLIIPWQACILHLRRTCGLQHTVDPVLSADDSTLQRMTVNSHYTSRCSSVLRLEATTTCITCSSNPLTTTRCPCPFFVVHSPK